MEPGIDESDLCIYYSGILSSGVTGMSVWEVLVDTKKVARNIGGESMKHTKQITKQFRPEKPAMANSELVCGQFILTGNVKCVPAGNPKAAFIKDIPIR